MHIKSNVLGSVLVVQRSERERVEKCREGREFIRQRKASLRLCLNIGVVRGAATKIGILAL